MFCVTGSSQSDNMDLLYQELKVNMMKMEFNAFPGNNILYSNIL